MCHVYVYTDIGHVWKMKNIWQITYMFDVVNRYFRCKEFVV